MTTGQQNSRVGSWFGPYRLNRLLGRGGMGEVYEAEDTRKGRVVALKLISPDFSNDPMYRERMQREAGAAGRLTEPHVVPIHDYGEINGQLYLDMRLIDGESLAAALSRTGPMSAPRAVAIVRQVAAALDAAHANGIIHRDVKPENILITGDDFAYLVDFGIARAGEDAGVTQAGMAIGTYRYMAPERFSDSEVTYRSDIYSLACVLGECLIGAPPFRGESVERLVAAHLMEPVPRPSQLLPGRVPPALDEVLAKGMAKNPADRYRSAGELAQAALHALTNTEQHQAKSIIQQTEAAAGEHTSMRPAPSDPGNGGWRSPPTAMSGGGYPAPPTTGFSTGGHPAPPTTGFSTGGHPAPPTTGFRTGEHSAPPTGIAPARRTPPPADTGGWAGPPTGIAPAARTPAPAPRAPDFHPQSQEQPNKRKLWLILGAAAAAVLLAVVAVFVFKPDKGPAAEACGQNVLPFNGLTFRLSPGAVAVDSAGAIYVTNQGMYGRVVKLSPGSDTPAVLPFTGLYQPQGVAVDSSGAVYVTDFNHRVVMMASGSNSQTELPFTGLSFPEGVTVDKAGNVYVADRGNDRVMKLPAGSKTPEVLPFDGLDNPDGVAVNDAGDVFVTDTDNNRVLKLASGSTEQTVLPFTGVSVPWGIAVNAAGDVYVSEHDDNQVVKLPANATAPTPLTLNGLNTPLQLAVDKDGNLYIADRGNDRVVKLHVAGCSS
ncbi:protein kinase [Candidatus Mycobacterium wuenschmannii]|uniref:non-specific serine/threonine protein kinase n=1 Tax=Candidatus Mycobacterium wuenschmannii TaxID=3027808 RepID=A0ABY8VVA3_9MYCO|nr:serine/threonine-protein kinase PknD [Candidatus Mycobacterium wuenschmannii]WIM86092.1 protein kinase [Candidatus Mycobacterium wuenschmannii]